jgi:hypothetical protein
VIGVMTVVLLWGKKVGGQALINLVCIGVTRTAIFQEGLDEQLWMRVSYPTSALSPVPDIPNGPRKVETTRANSSLG